MTTITTKDGAQIHNKDWGTGQPVVFSHGWPPTADAWEDQMVFLASRGCHCIARAVAKSRLYIGRHGTKRVAKAVLIGAVPPLMSAPPPRFPPS